MVVACRAVAKDVVKVSVADLGVAQPQRIEDLALVKGDGDGHVG